MHLVHTKTYLDTRQKKANNLYPVKLRLTHRRQQKYYNLGIDLSKEDWEKINSENARMGYRDLKVRLIKIEERARVILAKIDHFSFDRFEHKWFSKDLEVTTNLFECFDIRIKSLENEHRIGTAISYTNAKVSLQKYAKEHHGSRLSVLEITPEFLRAYEAWFLSKGRSSATLGMYLRSLRAIINFYIKKSKDKEYDYPFGKGLYVIPTGKNIKKALTIEQIKKIAQYDSENSQEIWARDFFLISYLLNGANVKDLICLKNKNVKESYIFFIRQKTENASRQDPRIIRIARNEKINALLQKYARLNSERPEEYIFSIVSFRDSERIIKRKTQQTTQNVNKYLKRIGENLNISLKLTTYVARHSYATILKRAGAPMELIQENIGHSDLRTTQRYLDSFEDQIKIEFQSKLLEF